MTYKTNRLIVSLVAWVVAFMIYLFYATSSSAPEDADLAGWAKLMLKFIVIAVISQVIIQIVFHIAFAVSIGVKNGFKDEGEFEGIIERTIESSAVEDEMDKLIDMKAGLVGMTFLGLGILFALVTVAYFDYTAVMMMNVVFISAFVSALVVICASLYYYCKGV